MSIFDSILDGVTSLFDSTPSDEIDLTTATPDVPTDNGNSSGLSALSFLGKTAFNAFGNLSNAEQTKSSKEDALYRFLQIDSAKQNTNMAGMFKPTKTNAVASVDPSDINRYWQQTLQGFTDAALAPQSQVSKYQDK